MRSKQYLYIGILLTIVFMVHPSTAQVGGSDQIDLNFEEVLQRDQSFSRYYETIEVDPNFKSNYQGEEYDYSEKIQREEKVVRPVQSQFQIGGIIKVIFYIILGIVAILLIYTLFRIFGEFNFRWKSKKDQKPELVEMSDEKLIEELEPESLENFLVDAKKQGNYALAIRYYFLLFLKKLQDEKTIQYHREKTNADYVSEIQNDKVIPVFLNLSLIYEYFWYGKKAIDKNGFSKLEPVFREQLYKTS